MIGKFLLLKEQYPKHKILVEVGRHTLSHRTSKLKDSILSKRITGMLGLCRHILYRYEKLWKTLP